MEKKAKTAYKPQKQPLAHFSPKITASEEKLFRFDQKWGLIKNDLNNRSSVSAQPSAYFLCYGFTKPTTGKTFVNTRILGSRGQGQVFPGESF